MTEAAPPSDALSPRPASLRSRLACGVYEGLLLFGVLAVASLAYAAVMRPPGDRNWGGAYPWVLLAVMAAYFTWFWSKGETLAMSTWHLRVRRAGGTAPPTPLRALGRFALSLLWFVPGLLTLHWTGLESERQAWTLVMGANIVGYALLTRLHPRRQYLHDVLAGTEMVVVPGRRIKRRGE